MDRPQTKVQSEISRIFDEYRTRLGEIDKKSIERCSQPVDEESKNYIEDSYRKLAEIIVKRQQESQNILGDAEPQVYKEYSQSINELELKVQQAKTIIDKCKNELHMKYSDLDKVIADARKKIECNALKL